MEQKQRHPAGLSTNGAATIAQPKGGRCIRVAGARLPIGSDRGKDDGTTCIEAG